MVEHRSDLLVDVGADGVAVVRLNRPERRNALSRGLLSDITAAFTDLDRRRDVRVVVLRGTGGQAFSVGADLKEMHDRDTAEHLPYEPMREATRNPYETVLECRKPTIAVLEGWVVGGGLELAMACDLRVAADTARFLMPESKVGLGANFGSQMLPRLVPAGFAFEVLYLAEPFDAATALRMGLLNRVTPPEELDATVDALAATLVSRAPITLQRYKAMVHLGSSLPIATALRLDPGPSPYLSEDRAEGTAAFSQKRAPQWSGR
ncbi:enoyl-CoA hydratase/isomerase family protein [Dactylosporangium sp. CA-139114]|uniref:enoyl-CoA hydratase/isomerase family protein n=1 Tax=Dactylosporangium sp. CA-139114 TaxID=3239931 RepID=UPI003D971EDE